MRLHAEVIDRADSWDLIEAAMRAATTGARPN